MSMIILFSRNFDIALARESVSFSLSSIYEYLKYRGLNLSPLKSKCIVFNRRRGPPLRAEEIYIDNLEVPQVNSAKFLGVVLDHKLNGMEHLNLLIKKGNRVANIITSLTGTRWKAHPYLLLSLYILLYISQLQYFSSTVHKYSI